MGLDYQFVLWNRNKKRYDIIIVFGMLFYLFLFTGLTLIFKSQTTMETLLIRAFGTLALLMLHIILAIGPLCRLNTAFLPLLYNRRHLGVSMFLAALVHGGFSLFQFHALGNTNPIYSLFTSNMDYGSLTNFPFQVMGFFALLILFAMAATSHDFYLKNLSPKIWKGLHLMVYIAYVFILFHVFLGAFQQETSVLTVSFMGLGFLSLVTLHIITGIREAGKEKQEYEINVDQWLKVCHVSDIKTNRAKICTIDNGPVAIYKYDGKISAIHNTCKHQGGPLGEGKVIDGCITCPWHGYQYLPHNGQSPPPFTDKVQTYQLKLEKGIIYLNPRALQEGTYVEPIQIEK
ncbi:ferric reductase-like transmembrane domain-containing protein [Muricauda sp. CAU 1633]|uniref:Rieske 2Fe-2S domain-containing protein n=1 Tax=Allomuricauda sp. CAU 1633 TaxID=2816036 RepID=UPI001A9051EE|nr:Rieske 2Fe-2S domain-containing protein [Muricauda sp. CAU 1633]MBO0322262.1 ferric reductase-like transmembrane domain-containing protein [Muricauda sp. CAU 1633]